MIVDGLRNCKKYAALHPLFDKAFDFLLTNDLESLKPGKIELEENKLWASVVVIPGNTADAIKMEAHRNYIDIQVPLTKAETIGWKSLLKATKEIESYNPDNDCTFYSDEATLLLKLQPTEFAVFFPEDVHQPGIVEGPHKKIIIKVRI